MSRPHYKLRCRVRDGTFEDDGIILECPTQHEVALLSTEYRDKWFEPDPGTEGMFRYGKWLPGTRVLSGAGSSVTYNSLTGFTDYSDAIMLADRLSAASEPSGWKQSRRLSTSTPARG